MLWATVRPVKQGYSAVDWEVQLWSPTGTLDPFVLNYTRLKKKVSEAFYPSQG
jgi:hypothetical protein